MISSKKKNKFFIKDDAIPKLIAYVVLSVLALFAIAPFIILISATFTSENALILNGYSFIPKETSTAAWEYIWKAKDQIFHAYGVTIFVTVVGTACSLFVTSLMGYALSQDKLPGRKFVMIFLMVTMIFNGGIVASYIIWAQLVHIKNTIWALIFPNLFTNSFSIILMMNFFKSSIPVSILESARLDGASEFKIFVKMILPLSVPMLATIGLMQAIGYWNDWTNGLYYVSMEHQELYSIQLLLNNMNSSIAYLMENPEYAVLATDIPSDSARMAIALIGVIPILIAYPFFQKYFAKGLTIGSVK